MWVFYQISLFSLFFFPFFLLLLDRVIKNRELINNKEKKKKEEEKKIKTSIAIAFIVMVHPGCLFFFCFSLFRFVFLCQSSRLFFMRF